VVFSAANQATGSGETTSRVCISILMYGFMSMYVWDVSVLGSNDADMRCDMMLTDFADPDGADCYRRTAKGRQLQPELHHEEAQLELIPPSSALLD
jgi:hypothetical protein